jgi:RND family efflux transporter MFP subunit
MNNQGNKMERQLPSYIKILTLSSALMLGATLTGCGEAEATADSEKKPEVIAIPVEVAELINGNISSNYSTTAVLEAKDEAFVVPRAQGIINEVLVEEGDYVEKGQVLASLDPERYELSVQKATADLTGIEKELAKIDKVYKERLVSGDTFDKLTAQFKSAKATLELAKLDLAEATIKAPISGFIAERNAKVGNLTESFQRERMFHIVEQKELYGIVHLPEKELSRVHKDQQATLALTALADSTVNAYVERISPVIDSTTGTFKVTLRVPNENNVLKAGMFAQVKLNYDTHNNATLLPRKALLAIDDKVNVFVISDGKAQKVTVKTGYQEGEFVEILEGLNGNEKVVVTGHQNLKDQAPIEIVNG